MFGIMLYNEKELVYQRYDDKRVKRMRIPKSVMIHEVDNVLSVRRCRILNYCDMCVVDLPGKALNVMINRM